MSFDIFKPFRKCFVCNGKRDLLRVESGGYTTIFHYYHKRCLDAVFRRPDFYSKVVDLALDISDTLRRTQIEEERKQRAQELRFETLRNTMLDLSSEVGIGTSSPLRNTGIGSTSLPRFAERKIGGLPGNIQKEKIVEIQKIDIEKKDIKTNNKFENMFKEEKEK